MEKNFTEVENRVSDSNRRPELEPALEGASAPRREKIRGDHCLNVHVSYELKTQLVDIAEKYGLSLADIVRQVIKAGIPVFESLTASQEELIAGFVQLLRKSRNMGELKK